MIPSQTIFRRQLDTNSLSCLSESAETLLRMNKPFHTNHAVTLDADNVLNKLFNVLMALGIS